MIRRKARRVLERSGLPHGGHDYKALVDIIETYPRDELLQISEDDLFDDRDGRLPARRAPPRAAVRPPRQLRPLPLVSRLHPARPLQHRNRERIEEILERELHGQTVDYGTRVTESVLARLHYVIHVDPTDVPVYDVAGIEAQLADATREWTDDLRDALIEQLGEEKASVLAHGYADAFPLALPGGLPRAPGGARHPADRAARSRRRPQPQPLRAARLAGGRPRVQAAALRPAAAPLRRAAAAREHGRHRHQRAAVRDHTGATTRRSGSTTSACGATRARISRPTTCARRSRTRSRARGAARSRTTASTSSCSRAGLAAREIVVLRAVAKYLRQTGIPFSHAYMEADARRASRDRGEARRAVQAPPRPGARGPRRERARRRDRQVDRRGREPRRGPDPAQLPQGDPRRAAHELVPDRRARRAEAVRVAEARLEAQFPTCRSRARSSRCSSTRRASRRSTCAAGVSRAAGSAGRTAARTSAPRCSG